MNKSKYKKNISISISGDDAIIIDKWMREQSNKSSSIVTLIKNEIVKHGFTDARKYYPAIIDIDIDKTYGEKSNEEKIYRSEMKEDFNENKINRKNISSEADFYSQN